MAINYTNNLDNDTEVEADFVFTDRAGTTDTGFQAEGTQGKWCLGVGGTPSGNTGPSANPGANDGYAYIEATGGGTPASSTWAMRRDTTFDTTSTTLMLELTYNVHAQTGSKFYIEYATVASPNETTDWTVAHTVACTDTDQWLQGIFPILGVSSSTTHIRVRCDTTADYRNDIAFAWWHEYEWDGGPLVRASNSNEDTGSSPATINLPELETDDLIVVFAMGTVSLTAPSGYTELWTPNEFYTGLTSRWLHGWYRYVDGTESYTGDGTDTVTASWTPGTETVNSIAFSITGAEDPATQAPTVGTVATGTSTTPDPPNVSPGSSDKYLWVTAAAAETDSFNRWPTDQYGVMVDSLTASWLVLEASSYDSDAHSLLSSVDWAANAIGVWPASTGTPVTPSSTTVTVTAGTQTVTTQTDIAPTGATVTVTPSTATVTTTVDVTLASPTVTVTPAGVTITTSTPLTLVGASVAVAPVDLTVASGSIAVTPDAVTVNVAAGSVEMTHGLQPAAATVSASAGTVTLDETITLAGASVSATPASATLTTTVDVAPDGATVTVTPATVTMSVGAAPVTPEAVTVTVAANTMVVSQAVPVSPDVLTVTAAAGGMVVTTTAAVVPDAATVTVNVSDLDVHVPGVTPGAGAYAGLSAFEALKQRITFDGNTPPAASEAPELVRAITGGSYADELLAVLKDAGATSKEEVGAALELAYGQGEVDTDLEEALILFAETYGG